MKVISTIRSALKRHPFRLVAGGLIVILVTAGMVYRTWNQPRLNVILITLDTTRADRLKTYGYKHGLTEAFDEFAKQGVVFERAYAPSPVTLPSHATMLTGLYPPEHDLRINGSGKLAAEIPFLPQILHEEGYDTGAFIAAAVLGAKYGLDRGFDHYDDRPPQQIKVARHSHEPRRDGVEVVDLALDWLKQRQEKPFFCWIHLYDAHAPYDSRPDLYQHRFEQQPYDAGIAWEMQQLERVIVYLKERKLDAHTLVIVAGDHGEGLDEHQETEHGMLVYNTTLQVPFVFVGSPECRPGTRVKTPVSLVDLTPTVLDMLRLSLPKHVSGRSLLRALRGMPIESRDCYAETETPFVMNRWSPLKTVISDRWKYIHTTQPELYDLENDPGELKNLVSSSAKDRSRLEALLSKLQDSFVKSSSQSAGLSEKDLANLRTLGYVSSGTAAAKTAADTKVDANLIDVKDMLPYLSKFEIAKHLGLEGRLAEAIALLQEIVQETNQFPAAKLMLGDCYAQTGRLADAEVAYRSVLASQPDFVRVHLTLGRVLAGQGQFEQAAAEIKEFLQLTPDAATAHVELAQVLLQQQKFDEAFAEFQESLKLAPDLVPAHISLGQLLAMQRRPMDAAARFEEALKYDPRHGVAHANLMIALAQSGQGDRAIQHGLGAVQLVPDSFEIRFNLGILLIGQQRLAAGVVQLREAQKLRPDDPQVVQLIRQAEEALSRGQPR